MEQVGHFQDLTPDKLIDAVEHATEIPFTSLAHPLNSYINRVYELQTKDGERLIAKFYRPGRWCENGLHDEHDFTFECMDEEIPVVAPIIFPDGSTLGETDGIYFCVFPKKRGRELEPVCEEDWRRLGRIVARLHTIGARADAPDRIRLHPAISTRAHVETLLDDVVTQRYQREFREICEDILTCITPLFDDTETIRIHGDCHCGNLLERPDEGIVVIDFDDMAVGPPVQDLWMLLHNYAHESQKEINLILGGYEEFREFDERSLKLIEPLRAMRILYYLSWCSFQKQDPVFTKNFPYWGNDTFWSRQISDLRRQLNMIKQT